MDLSALRNISLVMLSLEVVTLLVVFSVASLSAIMAVHRVRKRIPQSFGKLADRAKDMQERVTAFGENPLALAMALGGFLFRVGSQISRGVRRD